jgi:hypothetical protein
MAKESDLTVGTMLSGQLLTTLSNVRDSWLGPDILPCCVKAVSVSAGRVSGRVGGGAVICVKPLAYLNESVTIHGMYCLEIQIIERCLINSICRGSTCLT